MKVEVGQTARVFQVTSSPYLEKGLNGMFYVEKKYTDHEPNVGVDLFTGKDVSHFGIDQDRKHAKCVGRLTVRRLHNTDPITII